MIVDTRGIEITPPADWIKAEGKYTLKITEIKEDGYNADGYQKIKMFFKSSTNEMKSESFVLSPAALWKLKMLEIAVRAPEVYDLNDFVGRYTIADIVSRTHNDKQYYDVKMYHECALNDKLEPIPAANLEDVQSADYIESEDLF